MEQCPYSQRGEPGGRVAISRVTLLSRWELLWSDQTMSSHPDVPLEQLQCSNFSKFGVNPAQTRESVVRTAFSTVAAMNTEQLQQVTELREAAWHPPRPAGVMGHGGQPKAHPWVVQPGAGFIKNPRLSGKQFCPTSCFPIQSLPFAAEAHPAKSTLCLRSFPAVTSELFPCERGLCPPPRSEAGISLVSIAIGRRNQHIPVMLIYRPLGCQHKYLINRDMNNTA